LATSSFRTIDVQSAAADVSSVLEYSRQRYRIRGPDIGIALPPPAMQKALPNSSEFFPSGIRCTSKWPVSLPFHLKK
jgi:hypothetical protein